MNADFETLLTNNFDPNVLNLCLHLHCTERSAVQVSPFIPGENYILNRNPTKHQRAFLT